HRSSDDTRIRFTCLLDRFGHGPYSRATPQDTRSGGERATDSRERVRGTGWAAESVLATPASERGRGSGRRTERPPEAAAGGLSSNRGSPEQKGPGNGAFLLRPRCVDRAISGCLEQRFGTVSRANA